MTLRVWPVSTLVVVTMTPGRTAPEESMTVPVRAPVLAVWAMRDGTNVMNSAMRRKFLTIPPPYLGNFEIGRILHLKSEISKYRIGLSHFAHSNLRFRISDLRCRIRPISKSLLRHAGFRPVLFEARVNSLDKHVRSPRPADGAIAGIEICRQPCAFDLLDRGPLVDHGLHPVANDCDHVAIFADLVLVTNSAVAGNDQRPALFLVFIHGLIQNGVQCLDKSLNGASIFDVDDRILSRGEQVARHDHIGPAEVHEAVAVGDGIGRPKHFHGFVVVILPPAALKERLARPTARWRRRQLAGRRAHAVQHIVMSNDRRPNAGIAERLPSGREERTDQAGIGAGFVNGGIPAGVLLTEIRVDDVLNRLISDKLPDGRND